MTRIISSISYLVLPWLLSGVVLQAQSVEPAAAAPVVLPGEQSRPAQAASDAEARTAAAQEATRHTQQRVEQVRANMAAVTEVLDIGLADDEAGRLLREARQRAPELSAVAARVSEREREVARARLDRVRLLERRRLSEDDADRQHLSDELATQEAYLAALTGALGAERELATEAAALIRLLDSRLLWVGSAPPMGRSWSTDLGQGLAWAGNPEAWSVAGRFLGERITQTRLLSVAVGLLVGLLLYQRRRMKHTLKVLAGQVGRYAQDGFRHTVRALMITLLLALPLPLVLAGLGGLMVTGRIDPFTAGLGKGLLAAAAVWLLLDTFRQVCRHGGLADAHFHWDDRARQTLRVNLGWLLAVEVPAALVVEACNASGSPTLQQGLGRLAFLVGSIGWTIFVARVFRPGHGVFSHLMNPAGWAWRLRRLWYGALVLLPAALTVAAMAGYYYTATEVQARFFSTGLIVLMGVIFYSLLTRWLRVVRQRVALLQARQRLVRQREERKQAAEQKSADPAASAPREPAASGDAVPDLEPEKLDVEAISGQTLTLLRTLVTVAVLAGLWAIWSDLLPALTVLERIALTSPTLDGDGNVVVEPLTLWSLLMALVAAVLTFVAARNLPAVLELAVLQRFPLDAGSRYASGILTRYLVIAVGVVVVSRIIGIEWGRAQWIVAALGVGLGFGLQEIVANFVSGLIILFERPIRVGDTVTVGQVSGTVSRLQIRATTITDWDNKEILVPNKSFITNDVINWTLSSPVTRLVVPVGVSYNSDVAETHRAITEAVHRVPAVLDDPAPAVFFLGFGDSSLNFEARVFVGSLAARLPTLHELHAAILAALREADIEIPFPQRDLHLRTNFPPPDKQPPGEPAPDENPPRPDHNPESGAHDRARESDEKRARTKKT